MSASDNTTHRIITGLDQPAFAGSANLAVSASKVYQQSFIHLECLS